MNSDVNPKMYGHVHFYVFGWVVNNVVGPNQKQKPKHNAESFARKCTLSVCLDWAFCPIYASTFFQRVLWVLFRDPQKSAKHRFLGKFESYSIIYPFKNYFSIIFLAINFQFLTNKRYLNRPHFPLPHKTNSITRQKEERGETSDKHKRERDGEPEPPQSLSPSSRRPCSGDAWWFRCTVQYPALDFFFSFHSFPEFKSTKNSLFF